MMQIDEKNTTTVCFRQQYMLLMMKIKVLLVDMSVQLATEI